MADVLLLRGAPGAGKSTTAAALSRLLGGPPALAVVEVDELRGDLWRTPAHRLDDVEKHHTALVHAARLARALLGAGVRRVCVVDTFSAAGVQVLRGELAELETRAVVLHCTPEEHARRLRERPGAHAYRGLDALDMAHRLARDAERGSVVLSYGRTAAEVAAAVRQAAGW